MYYLRRRRRGEPDRRRHVLRQRFGNNVRKSRWTPLSVRGVKTSPGVRAPYSGGASVSRTCSDRRHRLQCGSITTAIDHRDSAALRVWKRRNRPFQPLSRTGRGRDPKNSAESNDRGEIFCFSNVRVVYSCWCGPGWPRQLQVGFVTTIIRRACYTDLLQSVTR